MFRVSPVYTFGPPYVEYKEVSVNDREINPVAKSPGFFSCSHSVTLSRKNREQVLVGDKWYEVYDLLKLGTDGLMWAVATVPKMHLQSAAQDLQDLTDTPAQREDLVLRYTDRSSRVPEQKETILKKVLTKTFSLPNFQIRSYRYYKMS